MEHLNFVAIDLETATSDRFSICEVGIAVIEDGQLSFSKSWLVQPPYNEYYGFNISIHGITPSMTEESSTFPEAWEEIKGYLQNKWVVAHNASFDMYALKDAFDIFHIDYPEFRYLCSYRLARKVVCSESYSLPNICHTLGIEFGHHHRAEGDAIGCANVLLECVKRADTATLEMLASKYRFRIGRFEDNKFVPMRTLS